MGECVSTDRGEVHSMRHSSCRGVARSVATRLRGAATCTVASALAVRNGVGRRRPRPGGVTMPLALVVVLLILPSLSILRSAALRDIVSLSSPGVRDVDDAAAPNPGAGAVVGAGNGLVLGAGNGLGLGAGNGLGLGAGLSVYMCGWLRAELADALFPAARAVEVLSAAGLSNVTEHDVVLFGLDGPCDVPLSRVCALPARKLFQNAESTDAWAERSRPVTQNASRLYKIGPYRDEATPLGGSAMVFHTAVIALELDGYEEKLAGAARQRHHTPEVPRNFLLYVNSNCVPFREKAIADLSRIGPVHFGSTCRGGSYVHNQSRLLPYPMPSKRESSTRRERNMAVQEAVGNFRFYFAFENTNKFGYMTEKILNGFFGEAVPIFYGTSQVFDVFNNDSFIYYDIDRPNLALDRIAYLESNRSAYVDMLKQPILADGTNTLRKYFSLGKNVGNGELGQRIRHMMDLR